jgi:hypothetical protein
MKGETRIFFMKEERRGFGYEGRDEDFVMKEERRGFSYEGRETRIWL